MRSILRRDLPVPESLSVVYVDQMVACSCLSPLQQVLASDKELAALKEEESRLAAEFSQLPVGDERFDEVSRRMEGMYHVFLMCC